MRSNEAEPHFLDEVPPIHGRPDPPPEAPGADPAEPNESPRPTDPAWARREMHKAIERRQAAKAEAARLRQQLATAEAALKKLAEHLAGLEAATGGRLPDGRFIVSPEAVEGAKAERLAAAASAEGAFDGSQVAALLKDRTIAEVDAAGGIGLRFLNDAGETLVDRAGQPIRDPRRVCRDFLTAADNTNLVRPDAQARYRAVREHAEAVAAVLAEPPRTVADLAKLPAAVRAEVLDGITPAQRAALANPTPELRRYF
ncbi:MAG TPA: hypothetical protein VMW52_08070 [Phycisphaerae bacterium]|nr:hypothetical protein [Phycisphaerae bacterium]